MVLSLSGLPFLTWVCFKQIQCFFLVKDVEAFIALRSREVFLSSIHLHVGAKNSVGFAGELPLRENTVAFT